MVHVSSVIKWNRIAYRIDTRGAADRSAARSFRTFSRSLELICTFGFRPRLTMFAGSVATQPQMIIVPQSACQVAHIPTTVQTPAQSQIAVLQTTPGHFSPAQPTSHAPSILYLNAQTPSTISNVAFQIMRPPL